MGPKTCAVCTEPANQRCGGCHVIYYCCRDHQRLDWKGHRSRCKPFKVADNKALGRHLIATRDIKVGEVILDEQPLVAGPSQVTPPVCLGCYRILTEQSACACLDCGWPMCSEDCARTPAHRAECDITKLKKGSKVTVRNFLQPHPIYQCVTTLRCLYLRDSDPVKWERLQSLESHCEERKKTRRYEDDRVTVAQFLRHFFHLQDFEQEEILRVCGILQVNGHEVPVTDPPHVAVYDQASLLEHSCRPNCSKSFTPDGGLIIHALEPILKGQHLSICYTDALWGTANRRHHLAETKFFWCRCVRCADPTEFGTYFSAVRCLSKTCDGYLVPENSLLEDSDLGTTIWRCGRCSVSETAPRVLSVLERVGSALSSMQKGDPRVCEHFLAQFSPELHPNHYYLTDVRLALAQLYGQTSDVGLVGISDQDLSEKASLCRQVLELMNTLVPAEHRVRGVLMFELHAAVAEVARRASNRGQLDPMALRDSLLESKRLLTEASFLLSHEPETLPEGKIALQARKNLTDLNTLLQNIHASIGDSPL
ncbi:protein msta isoform X2 [Zootermopsis nevadensis]|nr:protein msta isoform X2 [Zootermopsis nevadensis]XP_021915500.1 protein msta isoform X2 [Zootermopsis nevadensis]XP_021915501.1 protein msta isoform X2 [Zootermopsis nevadensis]XP_021915502.1 protein msta isoform X2 [Zootermopsis nevadensis]